MHLSFVNLPVQSPFTTPQPPLWSSCTLGHSSSALVTQGRNQTTGGSPCAPELLKLCRLATLKPSYPALPAPSRRSHSKGSCPFSSCSLSLLTHGVLPCVVPLVQCAPFLLGTVSKKLSFQWQSSDLLASPYLNNNKIYILKQGQYHLLLRIVIKIKADKHGNGIWQGLLKCYFLFSAPYLSLPESFSPSLRIGYIIRETKGKVTMWSPLLKND